MVVSGVRRVTFLSKTNLCRDTTINFLSFTALTLLYKDNCNSVSIPNILTFFSALEMFSFFYVIHCVLQKIIIEIKQLYSGRIASNPFIANNRRYMVYPLRDDIPIENEFLFVYIFLYFDVTWPF